MPNYDVIFIHPPAIFDFRKRALFPGAMGSTVEGVQFTKVPIGLLSLAEYLDRHGYKVKIDNLGDRMVSDPAFDAEAHLKKLNARIFAVGVHFQQHAPGAIEVVRLLKQYHPGALIVMGGLTATRFNEEIIEKYPFVDAVIRAEAEKAFLQFLQELEKHGRIMPTGNLTYRDEGKVKFTPLLPASTSLDEFEYTRFDLLEPRTSVFIPNEVPRWSLEVCRGCSYNCTICGGSAYTYKKYLGMAKPAFRSPARIIEDMRKLSAQGIRSVGLYQDPRMAGKAYWQELLKALRTENLNLERLSLDLLVPADEEFIKQVASIGTPVTLHICPDTGSDAVRRKLGRRYTTEELIKTVKLCHQYLIPVTSFFSVGLAGETRDDVMQTWELWEKLSSMENIALARSSSMGLGSGVPLGGPIIGPILIDPGSQAFDDPQKHGYKLRYKNLEEYIAGLSAPSWFQWLNYETDILTKEAIAELNMQSTAYAIEQRAEYGWLDAKQAELQRQRIRGDILAVTEVLKILQLTDIKAREKALHELKAKLG
jgi:B12-binding domain/radical SAM domain protein